MQIIITRSTSDIITSVRAQLRNQKDGIERRFAPLAPSFRRGAAPATSQAAGEVRGYAATFNSRSENFGSDEYPFFEVIEPGFFDNVLRDDVRALFNHDPNLILARSVDGRGTLSLGQDRTGLWYEFQLGKQSYAIDLAESMDRGDVTQSSFAFRVRDGGDKLVVENGVVTRTLLKGGCSRLFDCSPVVYPAYPATSTGLRDDSPAIGASASARARELDLMAVEGGFSTLAETNASHRRRELELLALE